MINVNGPGILCRVCGDRASGKHYGVASCDGCRGFFKRSIRRNLEYVCKEGGKCIVDVSRRNQCQACRFAKCLRSNMRREAVQHERAPRAPHHHHHHLQFAGASQSGFEHHHHQQQHGSSGMFAMPLEMYRHPMPLQHRHASAAGFMLPMHHMLHMPAANAYGPYPPVFATPPPPPPLPLTIGDDSKPTYIPPSQASSYAQIFATPPAAYLQPPPSHLDVISSSSTSSSASSSVSQQSESLRPPPPSRIDHLSTSPPPRSAFQPTAAFVRSQQPPPSSSSLPNKRDDDEVTSSDAGDCASKSSSNTATTRMPIVVDSSADGDAHVDGAIEGDAALSESAAKLLFHAVKWAKSMPAFSQLPLDDQRRLMADAWAELFVVSAVQCGLMADDILLDSVVDDDGSSATHHRRIHAILGQLAAARVDSTEAACLKAIILYRPTCVGMRSAPEAIGALQAQPLQVLLERSGAARMGRLMLLLLDVQLAADRRWMQERLFRRTLGEVAIERVLGDLISSGVEIV